MDRQLLKTFVTVAESGSFSAAALLLHCVQSNVTARIRRLEHQLGGTLFERGRSGARLTQLGERLRHHADDLLMRFELAERDLLDAAGGSAPLRLGAMETTAAVRLPPLLKALTQACPTAPISLHTGPTAELLSLVWDRKLEAAFVAGPVDLGRFRSILAFREALVEVRAAEAGGNRPLLAFRGGCSYRAVAENWLRSLGRSDTPILEMGTLDGILGCVEAGMGFAVAPEAAVAAYRNVDALRARALPRALALSETFLAWRSDNRMPKAHGALCDLIANIQPDGSIEREGAPEPRSKTD
ncbi:LysR family transcriptional regulator [Algihabitans albus]|uniref:LysR family transcriptional regulator n=1 Tax=Algihabitans albus TaxID=2164067 RepID=UPI000E5CBEF7|nr:LysR family transcriptional regulator [Algihabitans albus]